MLISVLFLLFATLMLIVSFKCASASLVRIYYILYMLQCIRLSGNNPYRQFNIYLSGVTLVFVLIPLSSSRATTTTTMREREGWIY